MQPQTYKNRQLLNILFWTSTSLIFLFESVGSLFFNSPAAVEGIRNLGFPDFFRVELAIGKIIGGILLIIPAVPPRYKEWAYVGFGISCISAFIGHLVYSGPADALMPVVVFAVLLVSYISYHKILQRKGISPVAAH